jgi:hypothetical protein
MYAFCSDGGLSMTLNFARQLAVAVVALTSLGGLGTIAMASSSPL